MKTTTTTSDKVLYIILSDINPILYVVPLYSLSHYSEAVHTPLSSFLKSPLYNFVPWQTLVLVLDEKKYCKTSAVSTTNRWLQLNFASCVIRQARSLAALVLCSICNIKFVNHMHDMVVDAHSSTSFMVGRFVRVCMHEKRPSHPRGLCYNVGAAGPNPPLTPRRWPMGYDL